MPGVKRDNVKSQLSSRRREVEKMGERTRGVNPTEQIDKGDTKNPGGFESLENCWDLPHVASRVH